MKKMLILAVALLTFAPISAFSAAKGSNEISALDFFVKVQGTYLIQSSGGHAPKEDNKTGTVTIEGNEGMMIFPYCQSSGGVCDPGFRSFPFETTRIYLEEMDSGTRVYSLEVSDNQQVRHFLWEESGESIRFKDQEYTLISGEAFPLEFITEKDPSTP